MNEHIKRPNESVKSLVEQGAWIIQCSKNKHALKPWNPDSTNPETKAKASCVTAEDSCLNNPNQLFGMIPARAGLWVVDIDKANGKNFCDASETEQKAAIKAVVELLGEPLAECRSKGKTKGVHAFYKLDFRDRDRGSSEWKLPQCSGDIRCRNGYILLWEPTAALEAFKKEKDAEPVRICQLLQPKKRLIEVPEAKKNENKLYGKTQAQRAFMRKFVEKNPRYSIVSGEWKGPDPRNNNGKDRFKVDAITGAWFLRKAGGQSDEENEKINRRLPYELGFQDPEHEQADQYHTLSEYNLSRLFASGYSDVCKFDGTRWWTFDEESKRWEEGDSSAKRKVWAVLLTKAPDPGPRNPSMDKDKYKALQTHHRMICRNSTANAVVSIAQTLKEVLIKPEEIGGKPHIVGLPNGDCWNLKTNETRQAEAEDYLIKSLGCTPLKGDYRQTDLYRMLIKALKPHYQEEADGVINYTLAILGHFLASDHSQEAFLDFTGPAGGGKSVLAVEFWRAVFGEYAASISGAMADAQGRSHPEWKLSLEHNRLVVCSDLNSGKWDADIITAAVSGETFNARGMRENSRDIKPSAGIIVANNTPPKGTGGVFRRIRLIFFRNPVEETEKDRGLKDKLYTPETMGVWLQAARDAWMRVSQTDRKEAAMPLIMLDDLKRYQQRDDQISGFVDQCLSSVQGEFELADQIYQDYLEYCETSGISHKLTKIKLINSLDSGGWGFIYNRRLSVDGIRVRALVNCKRGKTGQKKCPFALTELPKKNLIEPLMQMDKKNVQIQPKTGELACFKANGVEKPNSASVIADLTQRLEQAAIKAQEHVGGSNWFIDIDIMAMDPSLPFTDARPNRIVIDLLLSLGFERNRTNKTLWRRRAD